MFANLFAAQTKKKEQPRAPPKKPSEPAISKKQKKQQKQQQQQQRAGAPAQRQPHNNKAARELNASLSRLARGKQLSACRAAFASGSATGAVDAWSHAILINAHATLSLIHISEPTRPY